MLLKQIYTNSIGFPEIMIKNKFTHFMVTFSITPKAKNYDIVAR